LLFAGFGFFVASLYFLSSFIWFVTVSGTERLDAGVIAEFLNKSGLKAGAFKYGLNERDIEFALSARFAEIAFVSVDIKGTRAAVVIKETKPAPEMFDSTIPSNIVAASEGLIVSIATSGGTPLVKAGDVVAKGDILVSGELTIGSADTGFKREYTRAGSVVWAEIIYQSTYDVPMIYEERVYTGSKKTERSFIVFDRVFTPFTPKITYSLYEIVRTKNTLSLGNNLSFPLSYAKAEYREFSWRARTRTVLQSEYAAREGALEAIFRELPKEADIIAQNVRFERIDDFIRATVLLTVVQRIDSEEKIFE
jgi:similar to stage IV sporulation protein